MEKTMMQGYQQYLIPGVQKFIERQLQTLGLTPEMPIEDFIAIHHAGKHRYSTLARSENGLEVIFYARLHKNEDARKKFVSDIYLLRVLYAQPITRGYIPACFNVSTKRNKEWFTREYIADPSLGDEYHATHTLTLPTTKRLTHMFRDMQRIPKISGFRLLKRDGGFALPIMEGNLRAARARFSAADRTRILGFIHSHATMLKTQTVHPVHGDAHPGNILLGHKSIHLIDWETIHLNLRSMDVAYFYVGLGLAPTARKAFLRTFEKNIDWKRTFREQFPFGAMFYALNHLYTLPSTRRDGLTPTQKKKILGYLVNIVKKAVLGYTALRKV